MKSVRSLHFLACRRVAIVFLQLRRYANQTIACQYSFSCQNTSKIATFYHNSCIILIDSTFTVPPQTSIKQMPPAPHSQARGSSSSFTKHIDNIQDVNEITSFVDSLIFRIDGNYYDLTTFSDDHPGGKEILVWAKRKAWDHTQMFAIHHVNYTKAASMMKRYLITNESVIYRIQQLEAMEVPERFPRQLPHHTSPYYPKLLTGSGIKADYKPVLPAIDANGELIEKPKWSMVDLQMADCTFELPQKGSFYWELRYFDILYLIHAPKLNVSMIDDNVMMS